ncbi:MAG: class I SAM-dependent methyltransferase [Calothrix sp. C42_A2020_038]|nr:class I SAM-dependent methyltransferase [Calothrix sp. C42_A2020_038]
MMTVVKNTPDMASSLVNGILAIKPLASLAKHQARQMMIKRAHQLGIPWKAEVETLKARDWQYDVNQVKNADLSYPEYYLTSFHAYESGNMSWLAAFEVEPAAYAVHAKIWQDAGAQGDTKLRQNYHNILEKYIPKQPLQILDMGCSVGMSTFALQNLYPNAQITGLDLSPYFLAVAHYRAAQKKVKINWVHAAAESTGLPDASFDLVSIFLVCHELPQSATRQIFAEARRLLRPGGHLAIMDMNPKAEAFKMMPAYVFTLLKSTEPYLDEYFSLDIEQALIEAGFAAPVIASNSPRHRTMISQVI